MVVVADHVAHFAVSGVLVLLCAMVLFSEEIAMGVSFVWRQLKTERRHLGFLKLKLGLLKGLAREIGRTEQEIRKRQQ